MTTGRWASFFVIMCRRDSIGDGVVGPLEFFSLSEKYAVFVASISNGKDLSE